MADISELLADKDPEALQKLLALRDQVRFNPAPAPVAATPAAPIPMGPAEQSAQVFQSVPPSAAESAQTFKEAGMLGEGAGESAADVGGGSIAESATAAGGAGGGEAGASLLSRAGALASKAALPLTVAYELLKSGPVAEHGEDELPAPRKAASTEPTSLPLPSGGLTGAALQDYISKHPGPEADVGFNPNAPVEGEEEASTKEEVPFTAKNIISKLQALRASPTQNPKPIGDTLASLLGTGREDMGQAQQQRNQLQLMALLGRGAQQIGGAFTPLAERRPDEESFKTLMGLAQQPIQNIQEQKQAVMETLKEFDLRNKMDPNSPQTQILKSLVAQAAQKAHITLTPEQLDAASPETLEKIQRGVESMANRATQSEANAIAKQAVTQGKMTQDQAKAYSDMRQKLESFRGNKAAQQASIDILSADKALQLVKNKDPNTLTTQDLQMLSTELSKIASGGVPGEHGIKSLMPNNLQTKWAEMQNFITSKPTDANAAAYIQKNMRYLEDMKDVADTTLGKFRSGIMKGFKGRVRPEDYQEAQQDYPLKQTSIASSAAQGPAPVGAAPHGTTVTQGGHTFTWNPSTGKYE